MKRLDELSKLCGRALQIVRDTPEDANEAARFQYMCDKLQQDFADVPNKRIRSAIQFYCDRRGMI